MHITQINCVFFYFISNGGNVKSIIDHHVYKGKGENNKITKSIYPICVCSCMVIIAYLVSNKKLIKNYNNQL